MRERERERERYREREREREREIDGSDVTLVALKLAKKFALFLAKRLKLAKSFALFLAKNLHLSFSPRIIGSAEALPILCVRYIR